jgi:pyruvate dehydrogenase E2 component (dihydrolipoamide acetyltransferase)
MPTEVIMPQMGESIFEGTITKWLKKPGDTVQRDEPLFEISTDKVDAEIPSPASGILTEVKIEEGSTVKVNTIVALIAESNGQTTAAAAPSTLIPTEAPKASAAPKEKPATPQPAATAQSAPAAASTAAPASSVDVVMPQMGESIFEGTITKWLKNPGDSVEKDEPLFEISTDKVDAEIPAPESGILAEIKVPAGATTQINSVVAVIRGDSGAAAAVVSAPSPVKAPAPAQAAPSAALGAANHQTAAAQERPEGTTGSGERVRSSPLVRRIARDNNLDLRQISGTGSAGRITKEDVLGFMAEGARAPSARSAAQPPAPASAESAPNQADQADRLVPLSRMRSIIARRMIESKHTNAHVHSVFKIDMSRIARIREKEKSKYEQRNGVKLTYMPFIARAAIATLRKMPIVNASLEGDSIHYHTHVNLGIAVALDWGLIVPVIKQAEERNFLGIARAIADLAERARAKKLKPEEAGSGTFTITNPGIFGEQFGTPVINMPESAILGVGGLFKEPTVVTDESGYDSIAIRHVIRLTLGFDHRIIDGADAGKFMAEVKKYLESWNEDIG